MTADPARAGRLRLTPLPAFTDNYIWALDDGRQALVVDPGEAGPVRAFLEREGLGLAAILVTHHHGDHVGGVASLADAAPDALVFGPALEAPGLPARTIRVQEGDAAPIPALALRFAVLDIPGHTRGHVAFAADPWLFCGDTLFASGCGRLFEGTPAAMQASLDKLGRLPPATLVCCGHEYTLANLRFARALEPARADLAAWEARMQARRDAGLPTLPTQIGDEHSYNPYLNAHRPALAQAVGLAAGADPLAVFTALRAAKDRF